MKRLIVLTCFIALTAMTASLCIAGLPKWPSPPANPKVEYLKEIKIDDLKLKTGFFGKIKRIIGGKSKADEISLPFDIIANNGLIYITCQNVPALIEINANNNDYKLYYCKEMPFVYPISLCDNGDDGILITDSEAGAVYRFKDGKVSLLIEGLNRPTGIVAMPESGKIFVVETGSHSMKLFNKNGDLIKTVQGSPDDSGNFNYPTFAAKSSDGNILVTDALNYRIMGFDADGDYQFSFGEEGDGPGTFSRPKGIAVDSDNNIYVVDNLFDNVQIYNEDGQVLLVIGNAGQRSGKFWSPAGIDIENDTIYVADTFNNRIQVMRYLGGVSR